MTELFNSWKLLTTFTKNSSSDVQLKKSTSFLLFSIDFAQIVNNWIFFLNIHTNTSRTPFLMVASPFLNFVIL